MATYDLISELPLAIEGHELERLEHEVSSEFTRVTSVVHLRGAGEEGLGEDVTYTPEEHSKTGVAGEIGAQRKDILKGPDSLLSHNNVVTGYRGPYDNRVLTAVAMQQDLKGGQQCHEQCDFFIVAQGLKRLGQGTR